RLFKALYGLKQAPRAWYERLRDFLEEKGFKIGRVDTTLFTKTIGNDLFICQIYVDDIIFGSTNNVLCDEFSKMMSEEFEMSMIVSLLYLTASRPDIMFSVCMCARCQANPKESHEKAVKRILRYLRYTPSFDLWYPKDAHFELLGYSDSDFAGCKIDRKSTTGGCQLLGRSLVSWCSKKQNSVALSTAEAEYIVAGACCAQILYMKQTLCDYGIKLGSVPLLCDNESAIKIANNPVQHSRTKHIEIRHHFLRDNVASGNILLRNVRSE